MLALGIGLLALGQVQVVVAQGGASYFGGTIDAIPVQLIAGRLVVSCDASSPSRRIPVNLFVEFENPCGLQLHNRAAAGLRIETSDGRPIPVKLHFPGFKIEVPRRELGDEDDLEEFTKYYSKELGENAVVGVIGAQVLRNYHVTFDLAEGVIELEAPHAESEKPFEEQPGAHIISVTVANDLVWMPVRYEDGAPAAMALGSARYDSTIDVMVCDEFGKPAGNIGSLRIGGRIDISSFLALRPEDVPYVHTDGAAGVLGLGFLEHFRVEIDRVNRSVRLTQTAPANYPEQDFAFFEALIEEEAEPVAEYLEQYPDVRLSREAAELLLDLRLSEGAEVEEVQRAIQWVNETMTLDLRCTRLLDLLGALSDEGQYDHAITAGELAIESGRGDRYPDAVHHVHAKLGHLLLERSEGRAAWRHLLSAAFGIADDGMVNLDLGRYYESEGRYRRAFSRYVQACIQPESGPQAVEALQRVQAKLDDGETFSVDLVERTISGKVRAFGAAKRFQADEDTFGGRVALVEFFTNAFLGDADRGAIGGALGNQGLLSHFPPENAVFLSYHLPEPAVDPLCNELAQRTAQVRGLDGPTYHVVNGTLKGPGAARWRQGEAVYNNVRSAVMREIAKSSDYRLELSGKIEGDKLSGELLVRGPAEKGLRVQVILAEAGVLFPGKSGVVVHRMLARSALLGSNDGALYIPAGGEMRLPFECSLQAIGEQGRAYLDKLEAQGSGPCARISLDIDPSQVRLVAFVRDGFPGEVLQAIQIDPEEDQEEQQ